ncbi:MAG: hypothetical protein HYR67_15400 [Bacteroidetes bacterium]|nr:hypothetical protein [Bacteroidota bacterium]
MRTSLRFENCDLEVTAAGIEVESPKRASMSLAGPAYRTGRLVTDSPTEERGAAH